MSDSFPSTGNRTVVKRTKLSLADSQGSKQGSEKQDLVNQDKTFGFSFPFVEKPLEGFKP